MVRRGPRSQFDHSYSKTPNVCLEVIPVNLDKETMFLKLVTLTTFEKCRLLQQPKFSEFLDKEQNATFRFEDDMQSTSIICT